MVMGYPGRTQEYLPSYAVEQIVNDLNPAKIEVRDAALKVQDGFMRKDNAIKIQYASKYAGIANYWKKWIGETKGLKRLDVINQKKALEAQFTEWIKQEESRKSRYEGLLPAFESFYSSFTPLNASATYFRESVVNIELLSFAMNFVSLINECKTNPVMQEDALQKLRDKYANVAKGFYKNYNVNLDKEIFVLLMQAYYNQVDKKTLPDEFTQILKKYKGNIQTMAEEVYKRSIFANQEKLNNFLSGLKPSQYKTLENDIALRLIYPLRLQYAEETYPRLIALNESMDSLERIWTAALMEMQPAKTFYPDANLTLRVTYGKVDGYYPSDGVEYLYYTTIEGIMQKENPDIYDYVVENKLKELYQKKDYGIYANAKGEMPVAFIATNHTTGGNSGSPILNAEGHLLGLNFDRCWEGTMSDIQYDPDQCRNISVDIRYVLFIIDKFAGAKHLVEEMTLVR